MEDHQQVLRYAVDVELKLMGAYADTQVPGKFGTIREHLERAKENIIPRFARDAVSQVREVWLAIRFEGDDVSTHKETIYRLIDLEYRIQREARLI